MRFDVAPNAEDVNFFCPIAVNGADLTRHRRRIIAAPPAKASHRSMPRRWWRKSGIPSRIPGSLTRWRCNFSNAKIEVGSKIPTLLAHERRSGKHMGIFQRLIFHLRSRKALRLYAFRSRSKLAGQTRLPTFSINRIPWSSSGRRGAASAIICASRWQPLPVLT